jgi:hypothetical protein
MTGGSGSQKVNPNLVVEIVSRYVAKNSVPVDQMGGLIAAIHQTLSGLGSARADAVARPLGAGGACPPISAARLCRVSRTRVSRQNTAPTFTDAPRA